MLKVAENVRLDAASLLKATEDFVIKKRLIDNPQMALDRGVFGVPTFSSGNELFWGNDRLPFLESHLKGELDIDRARFEEFRNRPRGTDRKGVLVKPTR